jgi:Family of unknown function (DUF5719)
VNNLTAKRILVPLGVVVVLAAVYALAAFGRTTPLGAGKQPPPPRSAPATSVMRACPSAGMASSATTGVALVAAPATAGQGQADVNRLGGTAGTHPLHRATNPGQLSLATVRAVGATRSAASAPSGSQPVKTVAAQGGVVVQASGSMARGLEVEQVATGGIPSARCESPGTDFWFVGPGQHSLARIQLFLLNPGSQPADANVEISTDAGPLQGGADMGIGVAPHSMVVQTLAPAVRQSRAVALHVRTSVGQVVAAVEEVTHAGGGGAWLPAAQPPATRVVLPGLPAAVGTRQLFVAVPGARDAHLKLTAVTTKGSYPPAGSTGLDIPGGSAAAIVLPSLSGVPAALKLSSDVPITASAMLTGGAPGAPGVFTSATLPVEEQGVVAYDRAGSGLASELVLSAPGRAVTARISEIGVTGPGGTQRVVQIPAGHSMVAQLGKGGGAIHKSAFSVLITPLAGSGQLYAGRVVTSSGTGGKVQSLLPVISTLTMVPLPKVQNTFITTAP